MRLMAEFHVRHDARRIGRGRRHQEMIGGQARRRAVVKHDAVFAQHQAIARLADIERAERCCNRAG